MGSFDSCRSLERDRTNISSPKRAAGSAQRAEEANERSVGSCRLPVCRKLGSGLKSKVPPASSPERRLVLGTLDFRPDPLSVVVLTTDNRQLTTVLHVHEPI